MTTEDVSPRFHDLDAWPVEEVVKALYEGQLAAVAAVAPALGAIADAARAAAMRLKMHESGRLVYIGAGTSGRIGVQDGAELPPTFNWPKDRLVFALAGGEDAVLQAIENAEDSAEDGVARMQRAQVGPADVVIGTAASGSTAFTIAALREAAARGALTIGIANNRGTPLLGACEHPILIETGEEVIAGSTRMKAGTAQKVVLNLISTSIMIQLGRIYRGMMVHMKATNAKLRRRSEAMVAEITGCDPSAASAALTAAGGDVQLATLLAAGFYRDTAELVLKQSQNNLRQAFASLQSTRERSDEERLHG